MKNTKTRNVKRKGGSQQRVVRARTKLKDLVEAAHAAGAKVSVSLEPKKMPMRFPNDPEPVKLLIAELPAPTRIGSGDLFGADRNL